MPPHSFNLNIAGLNIYAGCRDKAIERPAEQSYAPFYSDGPPPGPADTEIRIIVAEAPTTKGMTMIFDSEGSWSLYRNETGYFLSLSNIGSTAPACAASFERTARFIDLYVSDSFITRAGDSIINPMSYPLDRLLMMYILAGNEGALFHAAGVSIGGTGCVLPGLSGAGKTTISKVLAASEGFHVLSDERVAIRKTGSGFMLYGTPWPGEAGVAENRREPLKALYFIRHGSSNRIVEIETGDALKRLLPNAAVPWYDNESMPEVFEFIEKLVLGVPAYEFSFTPDEKAADALRAHVLR